MKAVIYKYRKKKAKPAKLMSSYRLIMLNNSWSNNELRKKYLNLFMLLFFSVILKDMWFCSYIYELKRNRTWNDCNECFDYENIGYYKKVSE